MAEVRTASKLEPLLSSLTGRYQVRSRLPDAADEFKSFGGASIAGQTLRYEDSYAAFAWFARSVARVRSALAENAGSIFESTTLVPVEMQLAEDFLFGDTLDTAKQRLFRELLRPDEVAQRYYPLSATSNDYQEHYRGETALGLMARTKPPRLMVLTERVGLGETATAQACITYVFEQWQSLYDWFEFEPVPRVGLRLGGFAQLRLPAITLPQLEGERRTMRDIADEWLALFNCGIRQTSKGTVEIVARDGPDTPDEPKVLGYEDILTISRGKEDPTSRITKATCTSQGYEFKDDSEIAEPSYWLETTFDEEDENGVRVVPEQTARVRFTDAQTFTDDLIVSSDEVKLEYLIRVWSAETKAGDGLKNEKEEIGELTLREGDKKRVGVNFSLRFGPPGQRFFVKSYYEVEFAWPQGEQAVTVRGPELPLTVVHYQIGGEVELNLYGTAWRQKTATVSGSYNLEDDGLTDIETSRRGGAETLQSNLFALTPKQCELVAQNYVRINVDPRTIRDVQQSVWNRYPVAFDDLFRPVQLPNGEVAVVQARGYTDAFAFDGATMSSSFSAVVTEKVLELDDYLFLASGDFVRFESGKLAKPS